jgi:hypothetical protein
MRFIEIDFVELSFFLFSCIEELVIRSGEQFTSPRIKDQTTTFPTNSRTRRVISIPLEGLLKGNCIIDYSIPILLHYTKLILTFNMRKNIVDISDEWEVVENHFCSVSPHTIRPLTTKVKGQWTV